VKSKSTAPAFIPGHMIIDKEFNALCHDTKASKEYTFIVRIREAQYTGDPKSSLSEETVFLSLFKKKRLLFTFTISLWQLDEIGPLSELISSKIADTLDVQDVEVLNDLGDLNGIIKWHYRKS
jgi:hypothetical protein